ncbi:MAG: terminase gpA endonuclease subunit [Planctomycetota bacterium]
MVVGTQTMAANAVLEELTWAARNSVVPRIRGIRRFAEEEIVLPSGPHEGRRFRCEWQPYTALWFAAIDSGAYSRFWAVGPTQSGKSMIGFVVPILYHLFEWRETVIAGLPDEGMANEKWERDLLPVIERTRYREELPRRGGGSRGGKTDFIRFGNGACLKFMGGGGSDKARAHFTSRVVVITEVDGLDRRDRASREADKIKQIVARTRAYQDRAVVYGECTASTEDGRIWQEWKHGTQSRIALPCPRCGKWNVPTAGEDDRRQVGGWEGAGEEQAAFELAYFCCTHCLGPWDETERWKANINGVLVHRGQEIDQAGRVLGDPPATRSLGFRWSAINNRFVSPGSVALDEWRARREVDEENAKRELLQFVWALPYAPTGIEDEAVDAGTVQRRLNGLRRGVVPAAAKCLTVFVDTGKYLCHWLALAGMADGSARVIDYGNFEVPSQRLGVERGLLTALREFRGLCDGGWACDGEGMRAPNLIWVDSGYAEHTEAVYEFCREENRGLPRPRYYPVKGFGAGQQRDRTFRAVSKTGAEIVLIGERYQVRRLPAQRTTLVEVDADHWKTAVHRRLRIPPQEPGAITLFEAMPNEHLDLVRHLTAEHQVTEFVPGSGPGTGMVTKWVRDRKANHWFDCLYGALAAVNAGGCRVMAATRRTGQSGKRASDPVTTPDGRPFVATQS